MRIGNLFLAILLGVATLAACQRDERQKTKPTDQPDQKIVDDTKAVLSGIFDIINNLDLSCQDAAAKLASYQKDNGAKLEVIAKEYQSAQQAGGARAGELTKQMGRLVGNNTPAFRRFAKRCPEQAVDLEKTLEPIGGRDARKLAATTPEPDRGPAARPDGDGEGDGKPVAPAAGGDTDFEVRPPVAADLAGYLEGLPGDGPKLYAEIITSLGTFHCELFDKQVPMTIANFVGLARGLKPFRHPRTNAVEKRPYFDGIVFHRVIPGFMLQTGDPLGMGTGGPGYQFGDEFTTDLRFDRPGRLAMANSGPATNGSQFFITEKPTQHLDNKHTIFGQCQEVDLVKKVARVAKDPRNNSRPLEPVVIKKIKISRGK